MELPADLAGYGEERLSKLDVGDLRSECARRGLDCKAQAQKNTCIKLLLEWKAAQGGPKAQGLPFDLAHYGKKRLEKLDVAALRTECGLRGIDVKPLAQSSTCVAELLKWKAARGGAPAPAKRKPKAEAEPKKKKPKLVAFKSTGGKAPRKQLATKAARLPGAAQREARAAANNRKWNNYKPTIGEREVACVYDDAVDVLYDDNETFEARVPLEITAKDEIHLSTFGSPTLHRKRDAPLTPENVEQALAYLEGSPANITSFVAPARSEAVGPFGERPEDALVEGEGDHLELDVERAKAFLDAERDAMQLGRAPGRFPSPVYEDHDGDVLDLDVNDKKGVGDAPARGFKYTSFKTQPGRGLVKKKDDDGDVLELSPHSPRRSTQTAVIGREERWTEYSDDDTGLILSPKKVEKHRPGFSLGKAPDRWRVSDEVIEEVIVDHDKIESAKRRAWAAPIPNLAAGGDRFVDDSVDEPALQLHPNDSVLSTRGVTSQLGALSFGKRPGRSKTKEEAGPVLELDPGERPRDRVQGAADWAREAPRSPLQNVDEGNTLVLEPERGRPAAAPKGHVSMATAPGRHVPTRDAGGDVLTLNVTDPGLTRQDRAVSFASAPNKPKLPKKKKKRPRRQRPRPASAMGRALKALGSVRFF